MVQHFKIENQIISARHSIEKKKNNEMILINVIVLNQEIQLKEDIDFVHIEIFESYLIASSLEKGSFNALTDKDIIKHLEFCSYLKSDIYLQSVVNHILFHHLQPQNCLDLLTFAYSKLKNQGSSSNNCYESFYQLFSSGITYVSQSLDKCVTLYLPTLKTLPEKVQDEILERYFKQKIQPSTSLPQLKLIMQTALSLKQKKDPVEVLAIRNKNIANKSFNRKIIRCFKAYILYCSLLSSKEPSKHQLEADQCKIRAKKEEDYLDIYLKLISTTNMENVMEFKSSILSFYFLVETNGIREKNGFQLDHFVLNLKKEIKLKSYSNQEVNQIDTNKIDLVVYLAYDVVYSSFMNSAVDQIESIPYSPYLPSLNQKDILGLLTASIPINSRSTQNLAQNWTSSGIKISDKEIGEFLLSLKEIDSIFLSQLQSFLLIRNLFQSQAIQIILQNKSPPQTTTKVSPPRQNICTSPLSTQFTSPTQQQLNNFSQKPLLSPFTSNLLSQVQPSGNSSSKLRQNSEDLNGANMRGTPCQTDQEISSSFSNMRRSEHCVLGNITSPKSQRLNIPLVAEIDTVSHQSQDQFQSTNSDFSNQIAYPQFQQSNHSQVPLFQQHLQQSLLKSKSANQPADNSSSYLKQHPHDFNNERNPIKTTGMEYNYSSSSSVDKNISDNSASFQNNNFKNSLQNRNLIKDTPEARINLNSQKQFDFLKNNSATSMTVSLHSGFAGRRGEQQPRIDSTTARADSSGPISRQDSFKTEQSMLAQNSRIESPKKRDELKTNIMMNNSAINQISIGSNSIKSSKPPLIAKEAKNNHGYDLKRLLSPPTDRPQSQIAQQRLLSPQYSQTNQVNPAQTQTFQLKLNDIPPTPSAQNLLNEYYSSRQLQNKQPQSTLRANQSFKETGSNKEPFFINKNSNINQENNNLNQGRLFTNNLENFNTNKRIDDPIQYQYSNTIEPSNSNAQDNPTPQHQIRMRSPQPTTEATRRDQALNSSSSSFARVDTSAGRSEIKQISTIIKLKSENDLELATNTNLQKHQKYIPIAKVGQFTPSSAFTSPAIKQTVPNCYSEAKDGYSSQIKMIDLGANSKFQIKDFMKEDHQQDQQLQERESSTNSRNDKQNVNYKQINLLKAQSSPIDNGFAMNAFSSLRINNFLSSNNLENESLENSSQMTSSSKTGNNLFFNSNFASSPTYSTTTNKIMLPSPISTNMPQSLFALGNANLIQEKNQRKSEMLQKISLFVFAISDNLKAVLA